MIHLRIFVCKIVASKMHFETLNFKIVVCLLILAIVAQVITHNDFTLFLNRVIKALKLKIKVDNKFGLFLYLLFSFIIAFMLYSFFIWDH